MSKHLKRVPGRVAALRQVIAQGGGTAEQKRLAGLGIRHAPQPARPIGGVSTFSSGVDALPASERQKLPF